MIKIIPHTQSAVKVDCEYDEAQEIAELYSFYAPNYIWSPKYKSGIWDGKIKLFNLNACELPYGLLKKFDAYAKLNDLEYECDPDLLAPGARVSADEITSFIKNDLKSSLTPRDYQIKAVQWFLYHKKMIGLSATASGKSFIYYIFMNMLLYGYEAPSMLLLVPRSSLVTQMATDFQEYAAGYMDFSQHVHQLYAGKEKYTNKAITISTWQSLQNMPPEYFEKFDAVVVDEVHEATAKALPRIANHCINAEYRIGMTGHIKDCKIASVQLNALLGNIKTFSKSADLIERGYLADVKIKGIILKHNQKTVAELATQRKAIKATEDDDEPTTTQFVCETDFIRNIPARKKFLCQLANTRKGNTMVLFKIRDYGRELHRLIKKNFPNKRAFYIDGTVKVAYREKVRAIAEKRDDIIIVASYGTFSTGINIKNLYNLIFAESMLSSVKVIQSVGRILRKYKTKNATLYDVTDDLRSKRKNSAANYVLKHFLKRISYYDSEKFDYDVTEKII